MLEGLHSGKNKHEAAMPPVDWSQPPTASDGYDGFIQKLLAPVSGGNEGCDFYHKEAGTCPEADKTASRIHRFLKWSGIAFGVAMGGVILKKAILQTLKKPEEIAKTVEEAAKKVGIAAAKKV